MSFTYLSTWTRRVSWMFYDKFYGYLGACADSVYQALFSPPTRESLGTRLWPLLQDLPCYVSVRKWWPQTTPQPACPCLSQLQDFVTLRCKGQKLWWVSVKFISLQRNKQLELLKFDRTKLRNLTSEMIRVVEKHKNAIRQSKQWWPVALGSDLHGRKKTRFCHAIANCIRVLGRVRMIYVRTNCRADRGTSVHRQHFLLPYVVVLQSSVVYGPRLDCYSIVSISVSAHCWQWSLQC